MTSETRDFHEQFAAIARGDVASAEDLDRRHCGL